MEHIITKLNVASVLSHAA